MTETARTEKVTCDMTVSLDGFTSGPEHLDQGFMSIQDWAHQAMAFRERFGFEGGDTVDDHAVTAVFENSGTYVMGRTMFERWRGALGRESAIPRARVRDYPPAS
jgi:hypothetical protein